MRITILQACYLIMRGYQKMNITKTREEILENLSIDTQSERVVYKYTDPNADIVVYARCYYYGKLSFSFVQSGKTILSDTFLD